MKISQGKVRNLFNETNSVNTFVTNGKQIYIHASDSIRGFLLNAHSTFEALKRSTIPAEFFHLYTYNLQHVHF